MVDARQRRPDSAAPSARFCVLVGPNTFRLCWLAILLFHAACLLFCAAAAGVYVTVPGTMLAYLIATKTLALDMRHFPLVADVYTAIAAGHALFIASMLAASAANRQLAFFWWPAGRKPRRAPQFRRISSIAPTTATGTETAAHSGSEARTAARAGPTLPTSRLTSVPAMSSIAQPRVARLGAAIDALFGRTGLFGVNGRHFEHIMLVRELCEASLQGIQARELARLLPRLGVVRAYVAMLVVNCWSTLLLRRLVPGNLPLQRLLCLVCDLLLDFASVIGVWAVVVYPYAGQYDRVLASFPISLLTDEIWYVNFINDFRLVLISSWLDLGSQVVFFLSIFSSINDVKLLLRRRPSSAVDIATAAMTARARRRNSVDPHHAIRSSADATASRQLDAKLRAVAQAERCSDLFTRLLQAVIVLLGVAILATHGFAETRPAVQGCRLEVLTWLRAKSGCALLEIDCHRANVRGSQVEMATALSRVAQSSLEQVTFVHCPSLQMPPAIQQLNQLRVLKLFNSTVVQWDTDAALTRDAHPVLGVFIAARVNMTGQRLPAGLTSPQYPPSLTSIQLSAVDLVELPAELVSIWPSGFSLFWESSGLTVVPRNLVKMPIAYLSLADNAITELPPELAFMPALTVFNIGGNPLSELTPEVVPDEFKEAVPLGRAVFLQIASTGVETLPGSLIAALMASSGRVFIAGETPMCQALETGRSDVDKRLVELHTRGTISCNGGGNSRSFPLDAVTAQHQIRG